jgi:uncharacterized membrane protein YcaP (DUF421 family)
MWTTSAPWWEYVLRGAVVYVALMLLIRIAGKRTMGEITPFDLIVILLVGESAQGALLGNDHSVTAGLLVAGTLVLLNFTTGFVSARSRRFDRLVEGEPVVLVRDGELRERALKRENIPLSDLDEAIRMAGLARRSDVGLAMLETNGRITIVPRASAGVRNEGELRP